MDIREVGRSAEKSERRVRRMDLNRKKTGNNSLPDTRFSPCKSKREVCIGEWRDDEMVEGGGEGGGGEGGFEFANTWWGL